MLYSLLKYSLIFPVELFHFHQHRILMISSSGPWMSWPLAILFHCCLTSLFMRLRVTFYIHNKVFLQVSHICIRALWCSTEKALITFATANYISGWVTSLQTYSMTQISGLDRWILTALKQDRPNGRIKIERRIRRVGLHRNKLPSKSGVSFNLTPFKLDLKVVLLTYKALNDIAPS